jgi:flavin-dependent dehydrogenase
MTGRWDVAVAGGGPAGALAAARLAASGRRVVVLERQPGPHDKVCGEFISGEARPLLAALGIDPAALGAVPIRTLRLAAGRREAPIPLPFEALSLSRRRLDEALLDAAARAGAAVRRGSAVRRIEEDAVEAGGERIRADRIVLATGKHDLPGARRGAHTDGPVGFKMHFRLAPGPLAALAATVELHLFRGGYAGLEPIEDGRANLCLVLGKAALARMGRSWADFLPALGDAAPLLGERLAGAEPCSPAPLAIAAIPYGFIHRARPEDAVFRVGDQLAVIPSFAGDGISIALHSGAAAAAAILAGETPASFHRRMARRLLRPVRLAAAVAAGLGSPMLQRVTVAMLARAPGLAGAAARATRISPAPRPLP